MKKFFLYLTSFLMSSSLIILFYFSPIFITPPPLTGPYGVGRMDITCVDNARQETHVQHPTPRKLLVRFYYPTQSSNVQQTFSYPNLTSLIDKVTQHLPLPGWVTRQFLKGLSCRAEPNATPSSDKKFPIILFSHGIGGMAMETTYQEELASHGYVIASIFHPYSIEFVEYPDGTVISLDPAFRKAYECFNAGRPFYI